MSDEPKITKEEMVALFGEAMPVEAVQLLWDVPANVTVGAVREMLRDIAALSLARPTITMLEALPSDEVRLDVLNAIFERFCKECGSKQPLHGTCQCWNDE